MNRRFKVLEALSTRYLGVTAALVVVATVAVFAAVLRTGFTTIDVLAKFSDALFKIVALLLGTLWTLNRYFVGRVDATQFRVDCNLTKIPSESELGSALLIFRLDLINTGKAQIGEFMHYVEIDQVRAGSAGIEYSSLYRWPVEGKHVGGPIEPGSWSAINGEVACSSTVRAVRVFIAVDLQQDGEWTWHRTFDVSESKKTGERASI